MKNKDNSKTIIAVDFDNTLFQTSFPNTIKPNWRMIDKCKKLMDKGYCLVLWTCREKEYLEIALENCRVVGLDFKYVNENPQWAKDLWGNDCRKVGATWYIDDKALSPKAFLRKRF